jgi:hypothetical protein
MMQDCRALRSGIGNLKHVSFGWNQQPVMPGFMPGIHVFGILPTKTWMAGTSPAMTDQLFPSKCKPL